MPILAGIAVGAVIVAAAIVWVVVGDSRTKMAERSGEADGPSIAVLPFDNMSGDSSQDYFADGMTEAIITELSRVPDLLVIARNSSFAYKGKAVNIADVAAALGVRYVMEGSVQKAGDRVRITAQLIDAETGGHIWADKFDRALVDIFDLQDEVTNEIVAALEMTLGPDHARPDSKPLTGNMEAYDSYLQGTELFRNTTRENNLESRRLFEAAMALDPQFAAAHAAASWTYFRGWVLQWEPGPETFARARELALKAVEIDPGLPNAHEILASIYLWQKQHGKARLAAETAIKVGPNSANAYRTLADIHNYSGNPNDAWLHGWDLGHSHLLLGELDKAVAVLEACVAGNPNFLPAYAYLGVAYLELGRDDEARAATAKALEISPGLTIERVAQRLPYSDSKVLDRMISAWRKLGLS